MPLQPGPREPPVALDRRDRDLQRLGNLGDRHPAKEAAGDDLRLPGVCLGQVVESLVEGKDVQALLLQRDESRIQGDSGASPFPLGGAAAPGVVDQNLAHGLGRGGEEIAAVGDLGQDFAVEQAHQGFMDQGAGLERVAGPLVVHQTAGQAPQLGIDRADEAILRRGFKTVR
jgi:hypothetical protein